MRKYILLTALLVNILTSIAQEKQPSYVDVIRTFCLKYKPVTDDENYTMIAKKKGGWFVRQVNALRSDSLISENLFYSTASNSYTDLDQLYEKAGDADVDSILTRRLSFTSGWYHYERVPYYGYNEWFIDVINDYGKKQDLTDNELDGLARAYDNLALSYLWHQNGVNPANSDTLNRRLEKLEYPSQQRLDKVIHALDNAVAAYERLNKQNPHYQNIVGNSTLKLFNEYMHAYNQLIMCGEDMLARKYLLKTNLPEPYALQAKNYLNSCAKDAVLITYGDNDTYQLWYVQEKYGYRKDVRVINYSLLGLPVYIEMLKIKNAVKLSVPRSFLKEENADVAYFREETENAKPVKEVSLKSFLNSIYTKKFPVLDNAYPYPTYPYTNAFIMLPGNTVKKIAIETGKLYCPLNDMLIYDIVVNNAAIAPIYFTSTADNPFKKYCIQEGIVYRLTGSAADGQKEKIVQDLQKFLEKKFIPILSNGPGLISADGDNSYITCYYNILSYYAEKNDIPKLRKWLYRFDEKFSPQDASQIKLGYLMTYFYLKAGDKKRAEEIAVHYAGWLEDAFNNPSALKGFFSRNSYLDELNNLNTTLLPDGVQNEYIQTLIDRVQK